jgi:hypothetical protein
MNQLFTRDQHSINRSNHPRMGNTDTGAEGVTGGISRRWTTRSGRDARLRQDPAAVELADGFDDPDRVHRCHGRDPLGGRPVQSD